MASPEQSSVWVSLDIPEGLIEPLPGGETDFHITLVYLGRISESAYANACARVKRVADQVVAPLIAEVGGMGSFEPSEASEGKTPVFAQVVLPGGQELRDSLADLSASEFSFHPHVTLVYLEAGEPFPQLIWPVRVRLTHLAVHRGPEVVRFPFLGETVHGKS